MTPPSLSLSFLVTTVVHPLTCGSCLCVQEEQQSLLQNLHQDLEDVVVVMQENVRKARERGENLEELDHRADELLKCVGVIYFTDFFPLNAYEYTLTRIPETRSCCNHKDCPVAHLTPLMIHNLTLPEVDRFPF